MACEIGRRVGASSTYKHTRAHACAILNEPGAMIETNPRLPLISIGFSAIFFLPFLFFNIKRRSRTETAAAAAGGREPFMGAIKKLFVRLLFLHSISSSIDFIRFKEEEDAFERFCLSIKESSTHTHKKDPLCRRSRQSSSSISWADNSRIDSLQRRRRRRSFPYTVHRRRVCPREEIVYLLLRLLPPLSHSHHPELILNVQKKRKKKTLSYLILFQLALSLLKGDR